VVLTYATHETIARRYAALASRDALAGSRAFRREFGIRATYGPHRGDARRSAESGKRVRVPYSYK